MCKKCDVQLHHCQNPTLLSIEEIKEQFRFSARSFRIKHQLDTGWLPAKQTFQPQPTLCIIWLVAGVNMKTSLSDTTWRNTLSTHPQGISLCQIDHHKWPNIVLIYWSNIVCYILSQPPWLNDLDCMKITNKQGKISQRSSVNMQIFFFFLQNHITL